MASWGFCLSCKACRGQGVSCPQLRPHPFGPSLQRAKVGRAMINNGLHVVDRRPMGCTPGHTACPSAWVTSMACDYYEAKGEKAQDRWLVSHYWTGQIRLCLENHALSHASWWWSISGPSVGGMRPQGSVTPSSLYKSQVLAKSFWNHCWVL